MKSAARWVVKKLAAEASSRRRIAQTARASREKTTIVLVTKLWRAGIPDRVRVHGGM